MNIKHMVPSPIRSAGRRVLGSALDLVDTVTGRRNELIPPRNRMFVGNGDYVAVGEEFLGLFRDIGGLRPEHRVLDVGSGIGRMAVPLTRYLSGDGYYRGIEIVEDGVTWCQEKFTPRFPNFQFLRADVFNKMYHPEGKHQPSEYRFPYVDEEFDFVFLTSVFTHMFPADVEHYLSEISRVLKPGGRCFATFFLLTSESRRLIDSGASTQPFKFEGDGYLTISEEVPERAIAFEESYIRTIHDERGLEIVNPIRYGSWCGRSQYTTYQDIILSQKVS